METKSSAHYQREYRRRLREQGLVKKEVWILKENATRLSEMEKRLRSLDGVGRAYDDKEQAGQWNAFDLFEQMQQIEPFSNDLASVELIDGLEPILHVSMSEFGDLPVFLSVESEQIIVESVLWPVSKVNDTAGFNAAVLQTHKYFPLSTIGLDSGGDDPYYRMFGSLSITSSLEDVVFELEVLASNVIQATEAYAEFL